MIKQNKRDSTLEEFYSAYDNENWINANILLRKMIKDGENSAWVWTKLSGVYYEMKRYKLAVRYAKKALLIQPKYPLALWTLGNALYYEERYKESKYFFLKILGFTEIQIGKIYMKMGIKWARSLKCDCKYKISANCYMLNQYKSAKDFFNQFMDDRKKGIKTELPKSLILKHKQKLELV